MAGQRVDHLRQRLAPKKQFPAQFRFAGLAESLDPTAPLLVEGAFLSCCPFFPIELARLVYAGHRADCIEQGDQGKLRSINIGYPTVGRYVFIAQHSGHDCSHSVASAPRLFDELFRVLVLSSWRVLSSCAFHHGSLPLHSPQWRMSSRRP